MFFIAVLLYMIAIVLLYNNKKQDLVFIILSLIISTFFVFLFGMRSVYVGTDTESYAYIFRNFNYIDVYWAPASYYLIKILKSVWDSERFIFFVLSLIFITNLFFGVHLYVKKRDYRGLLLTLVLYYSMFTTFDLATNALRQGLAISFFLLGMGVYKKNRLLGILVYLLSINFHYSLLIAFFLFIFIEIFSIKFSVKVMVPLLVCTVTIASILVISGVNLFNALTNYIPIPNTMNSKYFFLRKLYVAIQHYELIEIGSFSTLNLQGKIALLSSALIPFYIYVFFMRKYNRIFYFYTMLLMVYLSVAYLGYSYRYLYLLMPIAPLLYYSVIQEEKKSLRLIGKINKESLMSIVVFIALLHFIFFVVLSKQFTNYSIL